MLEYIAFTVYNAINREIVIYQCIHFLTYFSAVNFRASQGTQQNDLAVMTAYGFDKKITESECVAELMKLYQKLKEKK